MSKRFQFYKSTILLEKVTEGFSLDSVHNSLKALFIGSEPYVEEMINKYFEVLSLQYIDISTADIKQILPKYSKDLRYIFDKKASSFFMVESKIWSAIQNIIDIKIKEKLEENTESEITERLDRIRKIIADYDLLLNLFNTKLLFVNVF